MQAMIAIAYLSTAVRELCESDLENILVRARAFNLTQKVTGVLLHHEGTFFQYIEGPAAGVEAVYAKVKAAKLHSGIIELVSEEVHQLHFNHWSMGSAAVSKSTLLEFERANWTMLSQQVSAGPSSSDGLELLLQFWRSSTRGLA